MNALPFSLNTEFLPEDAGEDKVDLELSQWSIVGIGPHEDHVREFKSYMGSPPLGQEDFAWQKGNQPAMYGSFFRRPELKGPNRKKLIIRSQAIIDPASGNRLEAPLCGGYCLFYEDQRRMPVTGERMHVAKLRVSLNFQRFLRHQSLNDIPPKPFAYTIRKRNDDRSFNGAEISFDSQDNWLPQCEAWQNYGRRDHAVNYIETVTNQVNSEIERACKVVSDIHNIPQDHWAVVASIRKNDYNLNTVETLWEFPSENPLEEVFAIGSKLMHFKKASGSVKIWQIENKKADESKEASSVLNSPCFSIPLAEGVRLRLYAKTNQRIRFEVIHTNLRKLRKQLLAEAGVINDSGNRSSAEIPLILKALRVRAAAHMNQVMRDLRRGKGPEVKSYSAISLLAAVNASVPSLLSASTRMNQVRTLLVLLCNFKGYRGNTATGPHSAAIAALVKRGVLVYDSTRQFHRLTDGYLDAADALTSSSRQSLCDIFNSDDGGYRLGDDGKITRLREC